MTSREERTPERARELADLLTWQLDNGHGGKDGSLQSALYAWLEEENTYSASETEWELISMLTHKGDYEQPESAKKVYAAGVQLLAMLYRAMLSHAAGAQERIVLWDVAHVWIVKLSEAHADLTAAVAELEQDAVRLVSA